MRGCPLGTGPCVDTSRGGPPPGVSVSGPIHGPQALPAHLPWGHSPPGGGPLLCASRLRGLRSNHASLWACFLICSVGARPSFPPCVENGMRRDGRDPASVPPHTPSLVRRVAPLPASLPALRLASRHPGSGSSDPSLELSFCLSACGDPNVVPIRFGFLISPKHHLSSATV